MVSTKSLLQHAFRRVAKPHLAHGGCALQVAGAGRRLQVAGQVLIIIIIIIIIII